MKAKCNHDETRLTCVDCSTPICSTCLVQCPVGFRCAACGGGPSGTGRGGGTPKRASRAGSVNHLIVARSLFCCIAIGYAFGFALPYINVPFVDVFICLFLGLAVGRVARPVVTDDRIGNAVTVTMVFGLLIGLSLTDATQVFNIVLSAIVNAFTSQPAEIFNVLGSAVSLLFNPAAFILGFWRASVWRF